jgi:hypothetical protein
MQEVREIEMARYREEYEDELDREEYEDELDREEAEYLRGEQ